MLTVIFQQFLTSASGASAYLPALLQPGGGAAGAARRGPQEPPAAQQAQPGPRQAPGGHLELTETPPGRHAAPNAAGGGERVGLAEPTAGR